MLVVGLTGGIASGKSVVSKTLKELGLPIIDADLIAREMVRPNEEGYRDIVDHFGKGILNPDQTINRRKLAKIIFSDSKEREGLNSILHPRIVEKIKRRIRDFKERGERIVILDAALLIEAGELSLADKLIVVTVSPKIQVKRLVQRDHLTEREAKERIATQMPLSEKVKLADYVIDNSGSAKKTIRRTKEVHDQLCLTITDKKE
ncbi:dephospho-CoA kinase [bacterium]|nr:dephospho-CoA kinase [bacterium]